MAIREKNTNTQTNELGVSIKYDYLTQDFYLLVFSLEQIKEKSDFKYELFPEFIKPIVNAKKYVSFQSFFIPYTGNKKTKKIYILLKKRKNFSISDLKISVFEKLNQERNYINNFNIKIFEDVSFEDLGSEGCGDNFYILVNLLFNALNRNECGLNLFLLGNTLYREVPNSFKENKADDQGRKRKEVIFNTIEIDRALRLSVSATHYQTRLSSVSQSYNRESCYLYENGQLIPVDKNVEIKDQCTVFFKEKNPYKKTAQIFLNPTPQSKTYFIFELLKAFNLQYKKYLKAEFKYSSYINYRNNVELPVVDIISEKINHGKLGVICNLDGADTYIKLMIDGLTILDSEKGKRKVKCLCKRDNIITDIENVSTDKKVKYYLFVVTDKEKLQSNNSTSVPDNYIVDPNKIIQHISISTLQEIQSALDKAESPKEKRIVIHKKLYPILKVCLGELILKEDLQFNHTFSFFDYAKEINEPLLFVNRRKGLYYVISVSEKGEFETFSFCDPEWLQNKKMSSEERTIQIERNVNNLKNCSIRGFEIYCCYKKFQERFYKKLENMVISQQQDYLSPVGIYESKKLALVDYERFIEDINNATNQKISISEIIKLFTKWWSSNDLSGYNDNSILWIKEFQNSLKKAKEKFKEDIFSIKELKVIGVKFNRCKAALDCQKYLNEHLSSGKFITIKAKAVETEDPYNVLMFKYINYRCNDDSQNAYEYLTGYNSFPSSSGTNILTFEKAVVIRNYLPLYGSGKSLSFKKYLRMCSVNFVRLGQENYSILPFPFKYLEEKRFFDEKLLTQKRGELLQDE